MLVISCIPAFEGQGVGELEGAGMGNSSVTKTDRKKRTQTLVIILTGERKRICRPAGCHTRISQRTNEACL